MNKVVVGAVTVTILLASGAIYTGKELTDAPTKQVEKRVEKQTISPALENKIKELGDKYIKISGMEESRPFFLHDVKTQLGLDYFLSIESYGSLAEVPTGYKLYYPNDPNAIAWIVPIMYVNNRLTIPTGTLNYVGQGNKSICVVLDNAFKMKFPELMSIVVDHERRHARMIADGIKYNGKTIDHRMLSPELYHVVSELVAYEHQLNDGLFSSKLPEEFKSFVEESHLTAYQNLWNFENNRVVSMLKSDFFYNGWNGKLIDNKGNAFINKKDGRKFVR